MDFSTSEIIIGVAYHNLQREYRESGDKLVTHMTKGIDTGWKLVSILWSTHTHTQSHTQTQRHTHTQRQTDTATETHTGAWQGHLPLVVGCKCRDELHNYRLISPSAAKRNDIALFFNLQTKFSCQF